MDQQSRQQALDNISPEDLAKIKAHQASTQGAHKVDDEWLLLAEFARAYGWQAYLDVKEDNIRADEMLTLIEANRRLEYLKMFYDSQASFVGTASANAKNPSQMFMKLTKGMIKKMKADK